MKLLFSEAQPDYGHYVFPWVVWAFPEPGETPSDMLERGFLPSARDLSRWYMARQIRVDLGRFSPSSENRRILRKGEGLSCTLVPAAEFALTDDVREVCLRYAAERFGDGVMGRERLEGIFASAMVSHVLVCRDGDREVGWVALLLDRGRTVFYPYAFYESEGRGRNLGMFLMTHCVDRFTRDGFRHIHLGTCYSGSALYKTQFPGTEFWDGTLWRSDLAALKGMLARTGPGHLLEDPAWLGKAVPESLEVLKERSVFGCRTEGPGDGGAQGRPSR